MVDGEELSISELSTYGVDIVFNKDLIKWDSTVKNPGQQIAALVGHSQRLASPNGRTSWAVRLLSINIFSFSKKSF